MGWQEEWKGNMAEVIFMVLEKFSLKNLAILAFMFFLLSPLFARLRKS